MVVGTSGNDTITVEPAATAGLWKVTMNGVVLGESFNPTGRVVISGGSGGADGIVVTGNINAVVKDLGGPSYVQTDSGNDVVIGSSANDYITTGGGRDIIAGNAGADTIRGGAGEDAIVADTINWGSNNTSIRAALETWNGADAFAARVTAMKNTPLFGSSAITNDGVQDHLFGETQADWFVLNSAVDRLRDFQAGVDISN
jgi:Ca2+-binding RTX toxin-like protein